MEHKLVKISHTGLLLQIWRILFILSPICGLNLAGCDGTCERLTIRNTAEGVGYALMGYTYKSLPVPYPECLFACFAECRCLAFQLQGDKCELLSEDRHSEPGHYKPNREYTYYDVTRQYSAQDQSTGLCSRECNNRCCQPNPCANGATCTELCQDPKTKFKCSCPKNYTGRLCDTRKVFKTCKDYAKNPSMPSGMYSLVDDKGSTYKVFCDLDHDKEYTWTLIESFSFDKKRDFEDKAFFKDFPINFNGTWAAYRLSLAHLTYIANHSTHFRATCNFDSGGVNMSDYLRGSLNTINLPKENIRECKKMEIVNVRGQGCVNCSVFFTQNEANHAHIDAHLSSSFCHGLNASIAITKDEDDFGYYQNYNPAHSCSSSSSSTTQWWLGAAR